MILPIDDDGVRPAGDPSRCFYCSAPKGTHTRDCVCRKRTVVMQMTIQYVVDIPVDWDEQMINFHRNESSFCLGNDIEQLAKENKAEEHICSICSRASSIFLREATKQDHKNLRWLGDE